MTKQSITLLFSTVIISSMALAGADDTKNCPQDGKAYKVCKMARATDKGAKKYMLTTSGQLLRITDDNQAACTIDQDVIEMKVSQHPSDSAVLYFTKTSKQGKQLVAVNNKDGDFAGKCLKVNKTTLMDNVKEFSVIPAKETTIINAALSQSGQFKAWDKTKVVYQDSGVVDYQINTCFGQAGKSFNSYGLFTLDASGIVTKVKGAAGKFTKDTAKSEASRMQSLKQFTEVRNVCN